LVFGAAGHGKVVLDILQLLGGIVIAGLLDDFKPSGYECLGHEVLGGLQSLPAIAKQLENPLIAMGIGDNWRRAQLVEEIRRLSPSTEFMSAIHPGAQIGSQVSIGQGTVIMAGVVVNAGANIGDFCILNTNASLDHDSTMGDFASLAPGVATGGQVQIGSFTNVGIGAAILPSVSIGRHSVVGAGSVVVKAVPDEVIAYGVPARVIRPRHQGERYLGAATTGEIA
jgi:sugar O-acyltransferase (sialic acid O-acetyltransferase NeuD family)